MAGLNDAVNKRRSSMSMGPMTLMPVPDNRILVFDRVMASAVYPISWDDFLTFTAGASTAFNMSIVTNRRPSFAVRSTVALSLQARTSEIAMFMVGSVVHCALLSGVTEATLHSGACSITAYFTGTPSEMSILFESATVAISISRSAVELGNFLRGSGVSFTFGGVASELANFVETALSTLAVSTLAGEKGVFIEALQLSITLQGAGTETANLNSRAQVALALTTTSLPVSALIRYAQVTIALAATVTERTDRYAVASTIISLLSTPTECATFYPLLQVVARFSNIPLRKTDFIASATAMMSLTATDSEKAYFLSLAQAAATFLGAVNEKALFNGLSQVGLSLAGETTEKGSFVAQGLAGLSLSSTDSEIATFIARASTQMILNPVTSEVALFVESLQVPVYLHVQSGLSVGFAFYGNCQVPLTLATVNGERADFVASGLTPMTFTIPTSEIGLFLGQVTVPVILQGTASEVRAINVTGNVQVRLTGVDSEVGVFGARALSTMDLSCAVSEIGVFCSMAQVSLGIGLQQYSGNLALTENSVMMTLSGESHEEASFVVYGTTEFDVEVFTGEIADTLTTLAVDISFSDMVTYLKSVLLQMDSVVSFAVLVNEIADFVSILSQTVGLRIDVGTLHDRVVQASTALTFTAGVDNLIPITAHGYIFGSFYITYLVNSKKDFTEKDGGAEFLVKEDQDFIEKQLDEFKTDY